MILHKCYLYAHRVKAAVASQGRSAYLYYCIKLSEEKVRRCLKASMKLQVVNCLKKNALDTLYEFGSNYLFY